MRVVAILAVAFAAGACAGAERAPGPPVRAASGRAPAANAAAEPTTRPAAAPLAAPRTVPSELHPTAGSADAPSLGTRSDAPAPLAAAAPFVTIPVAGRGGPAVVSLPLGATAPRPLLVATHGAGGNPEAHCEMWRRIVDNRGFVLCVRGVPIYPSGQPVAEPSFFYPGHPWLGQAVGEAVAALLARYGSYLDVRAPLFAGFSQGASMGAMVLPDHPLAFARAALVEGGFGQYQEWNVAVAERLRAHGGVRVLFVCGRLECAERARLSAAYLRRGGLEARVEHAAGAGHTRAGRVEERLRVGFGWLVADDPRWAP